MAKMPDRNYHQLNNSSEKKTFTPKLGTKEKPKQSFEHV